jgi:hypothetical protein
MYKAVAEDAIALLSFNVPVPGSLFVVLVLNV